MPKKQQLPILKILKAVFLNEPCTLYKIEKETGLPHATAHKKIRELCKLRLIKIESEEKFRTGLMSKNYVLTKEGFSCVLSWRKRNLFTEKEMEKFKERLDELASRRPNLYPTLEWWPIFRGGSEFLQRIFLDYLWQEDFFSNGILYAFSTWYEEKYERFKSDPFHAFIPNPDFMQEDKKRLAEELLSLIRQEPKLRDFVFSQIKFWREYYEAGLDDIAKIENTIKSRARVCTSV